MAELQGEAIGEALGRLTDSASRAVDTLRALLADEVAPGIRLQAARAILASLIEIQTHAELNARITALEAKANERRRPKA